MYKFLRHIIFEDVTNSGFDFIFKDYQLLENSQVHAH